MDVANLIISVTSQGLDNARRDLRRLRDEAGRTEDANRRLADGFGELAKYSAIALGALGGSIFLATKKAQSFETAMAEVNKTVDFAASDGLSKLKNQLLDLSKTIPLTFEELAAVAASGGQLGVAEKDLATFTETVSKMAIAFDMSAADAGDAMAKLANVFEIPISEIDKLGDAINTLSNNSPAEASEIVNALSRVGGLAKAFGLSADAGAALVSTFVALGKPAEIAASAVNSMLITFSTLDMASKSQIIGFEKLGLNIDEFAQRVKEDGKAAIYEFLEAVNKLPKEDQIGVIAPIIGREFGDDVAALAGNMGLLDKQMELVGETADSTKIYIGSMETEFQKMAATSANATTLFQNRIDALTATVGEAFLPVLNDMLMQIAPVVDKITTWAQANPELIRQIALVTASVLGSIVALKLLGDGVSAAVATFENLKTAFNLARTAITVLSGSFLVPMLAIGALIAAGVLLYQNWDLVKEKAAQLNDWVKEKFGSLPEPLQQAGRDIAEIFSFIWDAGREYLTLLKELYSGTFDSFMQVARGALQIVWGVFKTSFSGIVSTVSTALQLAASVFSGTFALIKNTVSTVMAVIKAIISGDFKAIPSIIWEGMKSAASIVSNMLSNILNIIKNHGKRMYSLGKDFIGGFVSGIKSVGSGVVSAASTMAGNAIEAVRKRQNSNSDSKVTMALGKDFGGGFKTGIKKSSKAVKSAAQKMVDDAIKTVRMNIADLRKELALVGDNSRLAAFEYDVSAGTYKGASAADIETNRQLLAEVEAKKELAEANSKVASSIESLTKQRLLFGNSSPLDSLRYDILYTDRYKGASQELLDTLQIETAAVERLENRAKAAALIRERFAKMETYREDTAKQFDSLTKDLDEQAKSPIEKLEDDYKQKLELIKNYEALHTGVVDEAEATRKKLLESYQKSKRDLLIDAGEELFGSLAGMAKDFAGEQSGIYRAMLAVEKGFAIARAVLNIQTALSSAAASLPFPANLPVMATVAAEGASIISAIKSVAAPQGFKQGGYTGNLGTSQVAGVVHGQEYVFDAKSTRDIGVDNLNAMRSGKGAKLGGDVIVNNYSSAKVETRQENGLTILDVRNEVKRGFTELQNPNSHNAKMVKNSFNTTVRR